MLLSESELRAALEPLLERVLVERLRLFQLQLEPRLEAMIAAAARVRDNETSWGDGLRSLAKAQTANACFQQVFELAGKAVGSSRALLVEWGGEMAVWRQEGTALPGRFAAASRQAWLREGSAATIQVRGRSVGALYWPGGALGQAAAERVELLTGIAGLALLAGALPARQAGSAAAKETTRTPTLPEMRAARNEMEARAQRFARLLIEDLSLYLRRERRGDFEAAKAHGEWSRFAPELERCRRAFLERYPAGGEIGLDIFEEATPRLAAD